MDPEIFLLDPDPRIGNFELRMRNADPEGQLITDPYGSGSYLDFFVAIGKNMLLNAW